LINNRVVYWYLNISNAGTTLLRSTTPVEGVGVQLTASVRSYQGWQSKVRANASVTDAQASW
jgi:hypothetical protein